MENTRESITELDQDQLDEVERVLVAMMDDRVLARLDDDGVVELTLRFERLTRMSQAGRYKSFSTLSQRPAYGDNPVADTATEVACALRISQGAAETQVAEARLLTQVFPEALEELAAGNVQVAQVRALIETTAALDDDTARAVQERVLGRMSEQNPATTRRALLRAVLKGDPEGAQRRHEAARKGRRVVQYPEADGMGTMRATLTAERAVHAMAVIDTHARAAKQSGDERTLDQARADSFYQLVTGEQREYPPAVVTVTVGIDTLLGIDQEPGELERYGPVTADTARMLAAGEDAVWRRLLTAPESGLVVKTDPHTYRPTAEVRRHVSARDGHCSFPGCAMPAARTDLDHVVAFDHRRPERGGLTVPENLQALCRRHHGLKTRGDWTVRLSQTDVNTTPTTTWTAPSGRRYETAA